jgi:hypothetical protein
VPANLAAAANRQTFSPTEPLSIPELKKLLPAEQPFDKASVSVDFTFDGTALKAALMASPQEGVNPLPVTWWRDSGIEILAVKLERQEQKPDGSWSDATEVAPPPGRITMTERIRQVQATPDLADAVAEAHSVADEIQRPAFFSIVAGQAWRPPHQAAAAPESGRNADVDRLIQQVKNDDKKIETLTKQKEAAEAAPVRQPGGGGGGGGGRGGGKGGAEGGGGAPGQGSGPSFATDAEKKNRVNALDKEIKAAQADKQKNVDTLKNVHKRDETGQALAAGATGTTEPGKETAKPLLDDAEVRLWTHDLTVEPGKTYRYPRLGRRQ